MTRPSSLISLSILIGAVAVAGVLITRPAQATRAQDAGHGAVAYVDMYDLVDIVIMGDESTKARTEFEARSQNRISGLEQQLTSMQQQLQGLDPQGAEATEIYGQYQQLAQMYQQTQNSINQQYQELLAGQIAGAYTEIHASVNEVAADQGYTFVLATRRGTDLVQTSTLTGVTQEILARPLVSNPDGVDLTDRVREHLGLPTMESIMENADGENALPPGVGPGVAPDAAEGGAMNGAETDE